MASLSTLVRYCELFVRQHNLGRVTAAETGFVLARDPDTVRAPDAAFVTSERVTQQQRREGFFEGAPELAVEVVSPGDTAEEVQQKVQEYLQTGMRLVWIVYPRTRTIQAYHSLQNVHVFTVTEALDGGDVLPGFTVPVKDVFE